MANRFWNNVRDLVPFAKIRANEIEDNFDAASGGFDNVQTEMDRTLRGDPTLPAISFIPNSAARAGKFLSFDSSGEPEATISFSQIQSSDASAAASAAAALASQNAAASSAASAASLYDQFDDRYLGAKASDPALDNDGNALLIGALYFNTTTNAMRVYGASGWRDASSGAINVYTFSGTGAQTAFVLPAAPDSVSNSWLFIDGVYQQKNTYSFTGATLNCTEAPHEGTDNVEVVVTSTVPLGSTTADLVTYTPSGTGAVATNVQAKLREFVSVSDFSTLAQAITYAAANNKVVLFSANATISVPTDAANLQDVFDHVATTSTQVQITVRVETGYVFSQGLALSNGDFSNFIIQKQSGAYTVTSGFTGDIFNFDHCRAPTIDILVNAAGASGVTRGIAYLNVSSGLILPNAGVTNVTTATPGGSIGNGLFVENCSTVNASSAVFTGCNLRNVHVTTGSTCELSGATLSGGQGDHNVFFSRGSRGVVDGADISGGVGNGLVVLRSRVSCVPFSTGNMSISNNGLNNITVSDNGTLFAGERNGRIVVASGAAGVGLSVSSTSFVDAEGMDLSNCVTHGILANTASVVNAKDANITNCGRAVLATNTSTVELEGAICTGAITRGIECRRGSRVGATSAQARRTVGVDGTDDVVISAGGVINFNAGVGGVSTTVNTLTGAGIIFR
jgi:hypothetical protein